MCPRDKSSYFTQFRCVCDPSCLSLHDCCFVDIASILCTLSHGMQVDQFHCLLTLVLGWQFYWVMVHWSWQVISLWLFCLLLLDVEYSCISHYLKSKTKQIDIVINIRNQKFHLETKNILCWLRNCNYDGHKIFFAKKIKVMFSTFINFPMYIPKASKITKIPFKPLKNSNIPIESPKWPKYFVNAQNEQNTPWKLKNN